MKFVYLDKKEGVRLWMLSRRRLWAITGMILLALPLWRESISGKFALEAGDRAVLRTQVPGRVSTLLVEEGQRVSQGDLVARLENLPLASAQAQTEAKLRTASAELYSAESRYRDTGSAVVRHDQLTKQATTLASEITHLELRTPISGVVTTPRISDQLGAFVKEGTELAEISDTRTMRARIYVSEYEMYKYRPDAQGILQVSGMAGRWRAGNLLVSAVPKEIAPGLLDLTKFKGMRPPTFYEIDMWVRNSDGRLKPGMAGTARIYGQRRSLAGLAYREVVDFMGRKIW